MDPETTFDHKPYHARRTHTKSKNGCTSCKARRVKCDESRPSCRKCTLRGAVCVYPDPSPTFLSPPSVRDRDTLDMKLLWHYANSDLSACFATRPGRLERIDDILKVKVPRHAVDSPFLMDSLLALSALNLQLRNEHVPPFRAILYRARAFEGYRKAVGEAKAEHIPSIIACSLLLSVLASHVFHDGDSTMFYTPEWMTIWRGINLMVDALGPRKLWGSGMAELFFRPPIDLDEAAHHIPDNLLALVSSIDIGDPDYPSQNTYYSTLKYLGSLYSELVGGFGSVMNMRVVSWFTCIPGEFVDLVRQRRPRAMIIIAHYLVFMKTTVGLWWSEGIGDREICSILQYLSDDWLHELAVPRSALSLNNPIDVAKLLLNDADWEPPVLSGQDLKSDVDKHTLAPVDGQDQCFIHSLSPHPLETRAFHQDKIILYVSSIQGEPRC